MIPAGDQKDMELSPRRTFSREFGVAALLAAWTFALHLPVFRRWWTYDDPQLLIQAITQSPLQTLFVPEKWRFLSSSNFTPLPTLSFGIDYLLFGVQPEGFFVHQLLAMSAVAFLMYRLISRRAGVLSGALAATMSVSGASAATIASMPMTRHYAEGSVLALAALLLWDSRPRSLRRTVAVSILYLLSMLAKEVFAPLPLLFILLSLAGRERARDWMRHLVPSCAAATVYLVWRFVMLGSSGGYGGTLDYEHALQLPGLLWWRMAGPVPGVIEVVLGASIIVALAVAIWSGWKFSATVLGVSAAFVLLPLVPVAGAFEARYAFVPWLVLCGSIAAAASGPRRLVLRGALAVALTAGVAAAAIQHRYQTREDARMIAEGTYLFSADASSPVLLARSRGYYLAGIEWLRRNVRGSEPPRYLSEWGFAIERQSRGVEADRHGLISPLSSLARSEIERIRSGFDPALPLAIELSRTGFSYEWRFDPPAGDWILLGMPDYEPVMLPGEGWQRIPYRYPASVTLIDARRQQFRVVRLVDRKWTITPSLGFPMVDGGLRWKQPLPQAVQ